MILLSMNEFAVKHPSLERGISSVVPGKYGDVFFGFTAQDTGFVIYFRGIKSGKTITMDGKRIYVDSDYARRNPTVIQLPKIPTSDSNNMYEINRFNADILPVYLSAAHISKSDLVF